MPFAQTVPLTFAALMVFGFPIWDLRSMGNLRRHSTHASRLQVYRRVAMVEWLAVFLAGLSTWQIGPGGASHLYAGEKPDILRVTSIPPGVLPVVTAAFLVGTLLPILFARAGPAFAEKARLALKPLAFLLPQGRQERRHWILVAVTAGICEEVLYRGFLLHVLSAIPALHGRWLPLAVLGAFSFGIAHLYQGWVGTLGSGLAGGLFIALFWFSGSLLPGIILHTLIDLRPLLLLPSEGNPFEPSPELAP